MSELLEPQVLHASTTFDPAGKTIRHVVNHIERALRQSEIEPEWVDAANLVGDPNEDYFGLVDTRDWPDGGAPRRRLALSVARGHSEGWMIQIDFIQFIEVGEAGHWKSQPVVRIKTLSRTHAWAVAAVVSRMLDID
ncbi:hypothetical protein PTKU64_91730 (plasmid) [Paraburkholderia terrae]|uniref:Uncharacterized protein n=2 Tax=Paraburkholderia terrae TaxID=311230 RepID=A0ABM7U2W8_9BURK|nr:hypothetical protein PTKU64_91730 [Paraburkholderia terrae]